MTVQIPSRESGYAADNTLRLVPEVWNGVFGDIHDRLAEIEGRAEDLQAVIDAGTTQALQMIAANVGPEIQAVRDVITQLQVDLSNTQADVLAALSSTQADVLAALAVAQAQIDALIENGAPASSVSVATISGLSAASAQAAFAEHQGDIDGLTASLSSLSSALTALTSTVSTNTSSIATNTSDIAAHTTAIALKANQATTYTKTETDAAIAAGGTSIAKIMAFS